MNQRARGFTLLEMIVVIGLFALVAAMAYGGLMAVMKTRAALEQRFDRMADLQKAYWLLRDDFQNGVARPILDENGVLQPALRYIALEREVDFTRGGWTNPLRLPRSTLRRVGYWWDSDKKALMRRTWPVLDRAPQTQAVDTTLLTDVDGVMWQFLDGNAQWQGQWPTQQAAIQGAAQAAAQTATNPAGALQSPPPPVAVELTINTSDWGRLRFLFQVGLTPPANTNLQTSVVPPGGNVFSRTTPGGVIPNTPQIPAGVLP
ncbi:MAG: type II secretion system protein GspJ [Nevskiaceae bacterium]|nr:MAG: type II secretion system protein GspJ [Nevskiaceae bacterium]TBR74827.1 MAG: type II secretion system protein GspJ [Nevskiaceae bacterium]